MRTARSKADLIREYVGERLPGPRDGADDAVAQLIGMFEGTGRDSASVDDVVYGP